MLGTVRVLIDDEGMTISNPGGFIDGVTIQYVHQTDIDSIRYPELVMKLANTQNGIITKQDVVELLKVTPVKAYSIIKQLKAEGRLELLCGG